jgi:hypothetical protein
VPLQLAVPPPLPTAVLSVPLPLKLIAQEPMSEAAGLPLLAKTPVAVPVKVTGRERHWGRSGHCR